MTPVERMARGIHDVMENLPPHDSEAYIDAAQAALSALLEGPFPPAMVKAGGELSLSKERVTANLNAMAIFRAMITAAIAEGRG